MAPLPDKSQRVSNIFRYTVHPSFTNVHSTTLCHTLSSPLSHLICPPSPAASPCPSFSYKLADLPQSSYLSHSAPTSEPVLRSYTPPSNIAKTVSRYVSPPNPPGTSVPRGSFTSFFSLLEPFRLSATSATPHQQIKLFSTALASPINEGTAALTEADIRPTPAFLNRPITPAGGLLEVKRIVPPNLKSTAKERHTSSFAPFQDICEVFEQQSTLHLPTTSPECSPSEQFCASPAAGAAQRSATFWEAAVDGCYQDREACHPFAHIIRSGLGKSFSLEGHTLLSPPGTDFSPPAEEAEEPFAGLRLDSPLHTHPSSPGSVYNYDRNDASVTCLSAITSASDEALRPHSPALYRSECSSQHLPVCVPLLARQREILSSPTRRPLDSQLCRLSMYEMYPAKPNVRQSAGAPAEESTYFSGDVELLPHEKIDTEDGVRRLTLPIYTESEQTAVSTGTEVEGLIVEPSGKERNTSAFRFRSLEETYGEEKKRSTDAVLTYSVAGKKSKACTCSLRLPGSPQTLPRSHVSPRGSNRRKRRRVASPRQGQRRTSISIEPSVQSKLRCRGPATVAVTEVEACSEPRLPISLNQNPNGPISSASSVNPSYDLGGFVPYTDGTAGVDRSGASADFHYASAKFSALHTTTDAGALDAATVLSTKYPGSEALTVADGVHAASSAFIRGASSRPAEELAAMSPSAAPGDFDLHFHATGSNEHSVFYPDLSPFVTHCNVATRGPWTPLGVSARNNAPGAPLSPGAIVYALAVKLFGFTPTPGFLPDPNPFDDPEHNLTKKLKRAAVRNSFHKQSLGRKYTASLYDPQVPTMRTAEHLLVGRTLSPTAARETEPPRSGSTSALIKPNFSPLVQDKIGKFFLASESENMQSHALGHEHVIDAKTSIAANGLYSYAVPPATAIPAIVCRETSDTAHHRTAAASAPPAGNVPHSTRYSQELAAAEYRHFRSSCSPSHKLPGSPTGKGGWYPQGVSRAQVTALANKMEYMSEPGCSQEEKGTVADGQMLKASLVEQQVHSYEVGQGMHHIASMNGSAFVFDENERSKTYYLQDGGDITTCNACQVYDGGEQVSHDTRRSQAAQISAQEGPWQGAINYTEEEPRCDCLTNTSGTGGRLWHRELTDIPPDSSNAKSADAAGEPLQNSSYREATDAVQYRESGIHMPSQFHREDSLYPPLRPHNYQPFSQCSLEILDRPNAAIPLNTEIMLGTASTRQVHKTLSNPPHFPGLPCVQDAVGGSTSPISAFAGKSVIWA